MGLDVLILVKEIINIIDMVCYVSVSVECILLFMVGGMVILMVNRLELLLIFVSLILFGNVKENFCFFYKGFQDNQECYY